jgi:hypothetical protein
MPTSRVAEFPTPGPVLAGGERPVQQQARTFTLLVSAFTIGFGMPGQPSGEPGTTEHKQRYLRGEEIWCELFCVPSGTSPAASSRPPSAVTKAAGPQPCVPAGRRRKCWRQDGLASTA